MVVSAGGTIAQYANDATRTTRTDRPGSTPWNVVTVGDFDIDGGLDVAAASTSDSVARIFYRSGGSSGAIPTAASPRGIEAADLDRDGVPELVLAGRASSTVSVLSRQPDGTYRNAEFPAGRGARDLAIVDHDRGGALDILTANEYGDSLSLLFNSTLLRPAAYAFDPVVVPDDYYNSAYAVADFNHNGRPDVVRDRGVLLDGTTHVPLIADNAWGGAADVNGDGHADAIFSNRATLQTFLGDGAGGFTAGPTTGTSWSAGILRTADMNRDGRMDVVLSVNSGINNAIEVWTGTGTGRFTRHYHADTYAANALDLADVDLEWDPRHSRHQPQRRRGVPLRRHRRRDRRQVVRRRQPAIRAGGRASSTTTARRTSSSPKAPSSRGDSASGTRVGVALGNGDGTFREVAEHDLGATGPGVRRHLEWSSSEISTMTPFRIFLTSNGALLFGSSDGTLSEPHWFGVFVRFSAVMADLTGDGLTDVIGATMEGNENAPVIMKNTLRQPSENRAPIGIALPSGANGIRGFFDSDNQWDIYAGDGYRPQYPLLRFRWTTGDGRVFGTERGPAQPWAPASISSRSPPTTGAAALSATRWSSRLRRTWKPSSGRPRCCHGAWEVVADSSAASGNRLFHPDAGAPKSTAPLANPVDYLEIPFLADKTQVYKLWVRLKAERNYWGNDSVWVQVTGAKDQAGNPLYAIGSSSGLAVNLEECANCGISGWGWEDDGWGSVNRNGVLLHFPEGGVQTLRIQTREDGVSIDQIVLSASRYRTARPGSAKNDDTKLEPAGPAAWW